MQKSALNPKYFPAVIVLLAAILLFWETGNHDLMEWDEARNGANAWYMYHNHDFINYYYGNHLDTWNAKPPLLIWLITLSYKIFGFNEFALRLPAALSALLFFPVFYRLIHIFEPAGKAFVACLILLGCRAIASAHMGRTGDFDAPLLLFLTYSVYFLCLYLYRGKRSGIYLSAIFTGLAFYTKGPAALLYLPGIILFLLLTKQLIPLLRNSRFYTAMLLFLAIASSWVVLVYTFGKTPQGSFYGTKNSIETLLVHDTFKRIVSNEFSANVTRDNFFFFHTLEVRMNMWHILFYLAVLTGAYYLLKNRSHISAYIQSDKNIFTLLSSCIALPIILIVNFAQNVQDWYFAPAWPSIALITASWMIYVSGKWKPAGYVWTALIIFNLVKQFMFIDGQPEAMHRTLNRGNPALAHESYVIITEIPGQNLVLYLHWMNMGFYLVKDDIALKQQRDKVAIINKSRFNPEHFELISTFDQYCLAKIK